MALLDLFGKKPSPFSKLSITNFFVDTFERGFTPKMKKTTQTGVPSKFTIIGKITKYKP